MLHETTFDSFNDILTFANDQVELLLASNFTIIKPEDCGLDNRTAYKLWIGDDGIVIRKSDAHTANYYGGLEYVNKEDIDSVGDYILYTADSDRIAGHIDEWACSLDTETAE